MKKLVITAALALGAFGITNAQQDINEPQLSENVGTSPIQQGNWIVGGSVGSLGYSFEGETFNINVMPSAGYFVSDGIAIGLTAGAGLQTVKGDGDNVWNYKVAPFVRYYFPEGASSTGRFFGQGDIKDVEQALQGTKMTREDLTHQLKQLDIVYYFGNVTVESLVEMILS